MLHMQDISQIVVSLAASSNGIIYLVNSLLSNENVRVYLFFYKLERDAWYELHRAK